MVVTIDKIPDTIVINTENNVLDPSFVYDDI